MRGKGQLLISTFLLFFFNVFAQNAGAHAKCGSHSDEDGVTSSTMAVPGEGASSNSAAFGAPAAMNEGLDAVQTNLSPSLASAGADSPLFFMNHPNKQISQAGSQTSSSRVPNSPSHLGLTDGRNAESEQRNKKEHEHYHRHYRRARRGGYTVPYFVGKRILEDMSDVAQDFQKRNTLDEDLLNRLRDQQGLVSEVGPPVITDKRYTPMFVGKRSAKHRVRREAYNAPYFVGKRTLEESEDLEQEELQKRNIPSNDGLANDLPELQDLGALDLSNEDGAEILDKRQAPLFVGKRRAPYFIGKRWVPYFVGKRQAPYFVGKRADLTVNRRAAPLFVGRRRQAPLFIGKRHAPMFIGKRASAPLFVGKRRAPLFIGKRASKDWNVLLSALHTLQAARHYRRMIQADKRHNAPFFVGRRSSPQAEDTQPTTFGSMEDDNDNDSSWRENSADDLNNLNKRFDKFVGKQADDTNAADKRYEFIGKQPYEFLGKRNFYEFLGKRSPYEFLGKRSPAYEFLGKRSPAYEFLGKRHLAHEFLGKRSPAYEFLGKRHPAYEFLGKRHPAYEFLGKRSPAYEFLGKRSPAYEFLGKRHPAYAFLGKRSPAYEFLGKRHPVYEFLGKRSPAYEFLGKRHPAYEFLGKRSPAYELLGKRHPAYEFLGKRSPAYEFLGKRSPAYEFLGKRHPAYEFLGKRSPAYEFLGKRHPAYEFLGKRSPAYEFLGKRHPAYEFLGKRSPAYEFLGKRNLYEFLGKRDSSPDQHPSPLATKKRALVDFYGKRVELPYEFVGKRSSSGGDWEHTEDKSLQAGLQSKTKTGSHDSVNQSEADDNKRYMEWLGKRGVQSPGRMFQTLTPKHMSAIFSDLLKNGASSQSNDHPGESLRKKYTEFVGK